MEIVKGDVVIKDVTAEEALVLVKALNRKPYAKQDKTLDERSVRTVRGTARKRTHRFWSDEQNRIIEAAAARDLNARDLKDHPLLKGFTRAAVATRLWRVKNGVA